MNTSDYSFGAKLLHRMVLGSPALCELSFDIEQTVHASGKYAHGYDDRYVFVSGLARSGTTALLRSFHDTRLFASLTYADMPFILAPNLWSTVSFTQKHMELKERAHKDGIWVNAKSPEALDEVFWKVFLHDSYILPDRLVLNDIPADVLARYESYIQLILKRNYKGQTLRYLSKNNNNILRFQPILSKFPKAVIIIPFREPVQHALSLQAQHLHFCRMQTDDRFILDYMNWIGHHEFGLNHKPFCLKDMAMMSRLTDFDRTSVNYWLLTWLNYYSYVMENFSTTCVLFSYEIFCRAPAKAMQQLFEKIELPENIAFDATPFQPKTRSDDEADERILAECHALYGNMLNRVMS
jgi:hypothetical protein